MSDTTELERKADQFAQRYMAIYEQTPGEITLLGPNVIISEMKKAIYNAYVQGARESCRWRKCSEELPPILGRYLCLIEDTTSECDCCGESARSFVDIVRYANDEWFPDRHWMRVVLWTELPAPEGE